MEPGANNGSLIEEKIDIVFINEACRTLFGYFVEVKESAE